MTRAHRTALAALASLSSGAAPAERVARPGETTPISINGEVRRARIEPGAPGLVLLTQDYADAAGLKAGAIGISVGYAVGDAHVLGTTAVARVAFADPADVVVTAKRHVRPRPGTLALGADDLAGCSSLVFDQPAREIRLTCG